MYYNNIIHTGFMHLTGSEKLIFITSFMVLMNWGVRVSQLVINNALS